MCILNVKKLLFFSIIAVSLVSVSIISISAQSSYEIPSWVKGIAEFWAEGKITDAEFGEGLTFLIDNNIIKVPKIQELENKIVQLENENNELRKHVENYEDEPIQSSSITVSTNKSNYDEGETIVITGKVSTIIGETLATLQVFTYGNLVDIAQVKITENGSYSHVIVAEGPLWNEQGTYLIRASYGEGNIAESKFDYTPNPREEIPAQTCDNSYPDVCIEPYPPDLNCGDIIFTNFRVLQPDPHGFDRDKDGIGCES